MRDTVARTGSYIGPVKTADSNGNGSAARTMIGVKYREGGMKRPVFSAFAVVGVLLLVQAGVSAQTTVIKASRPTHYFYTPAPYVNPPLNLVLSFHEISFSFPGNLQVQASLLDNIGRVNFGAKFGIRDNLSIGAGLASTLIHVGRYGHGIPEGHYRVGVYLCYGFLETQRVESAFTFHTQFADHFSLGVDWGLMGTPNEWWSLIVEVGTSLDLTAHRYDRDHDVLFYFNVDGGIRVHPPAIPFMSFDLGIDLEEFAFRRHVHPGVTIFFDAIFSMALQ